MSRSYGMALEVTGHDKTRRYHIIAAGQEVWKWEDDEIVIEARDECDENIHFFEAPGSLCGGESEEEFADRVSAAVMRANGGPCAVLVMAFCYENTPCTSHVRDEEFWDSLDKEDET